MLRHFITLINLVVFVLLIWSYSGRNKTLPEQEAHISLVEEVNKTDSLKRTLIGVQPYMEIEDYFFQPRFKSKMKQYLDAASQQGLIADKTIIVFPENIGKWLVFLGEKHGIAEKESLDEAMKIITYSNTFDFLLGLIKTHEYEEDRTASGVFRMKAKNMAKAYFTTFSELAIESQTYILAGSIVLPGPSVIDGQLVVNLKDSLYNAAYIFGPDGKIVGEGTKNSITRLDTNVFSQKAQNQDFDQFELPISNTNLVIASEQGADENPAFEQNNFSHILVKILNPGKEITGMILNCDDQTLGIQVFLKGDFWGLHNAGDPLVYFDEKIQSVSSAEKGGVWAVHY